MKKIFNFKGAEERLDKYLSRQLAGVSRSRVQRLILDGRVKVKGSAVGDKNFRLSAGDRVEADYKLPRPLLAPEVKLKKVYEDGDVIVIDKPAGLMVHPTAARNERSVAGALLAQVAGIAEVGEDRFRPGIVHRLDADTSGLLAVAKNQKAFEFLKAGFKSRRVIKRYRVLVHGKLSSRHALINEPIGRRAGQGRLRAGIGRPALTEYWVEGVYGNRADITPSAFAKATADRQPPLNLRGGKGEISQAEDRKLDYYTLLRVQLHTGRTHQVRVHFSSRGHPVAGDRLYGGKFKETDKLIFSRQFLHADYLKLPLPSGGIREFQIGLPADLKKALNLLQKL